MKFTNSAMRFQAQYSKNIADLQQGNEYSYSELSSCQKEESAMNFYLCRSLMEWHSCLLCLTAEKTAISLRETTIDLFHAYTSGLIVPTTIFGHVAYSAATVPSDTLTL